MRDPEHHLFFTHRVTPKRLHLDREEYHHAVSVLRIRGHQPFQVTDGKGSIFTCRRLEEVDDGGYAAIVSHRWCTPSVPRISLLVGLPARAAFERVLELVVPLGVAQIVPVVCRACQEHWWKPKWDKLSLRFRKKMIEAMKQSLGGFLPELAKPVPLAEALDRRANCCLVAQQEGTPLLRAVREKEPEEVACVIGPPGGFSDEERHMLRERGAVPVALAPTRLRTELASVVACAALTQYSISLSRGATSSGAPPGLIQ
jgi:16S rRNA (uracil1498-N3)-methyltransferase